MSENRAALIAWLLLVALSASVGLSAGNRTCKEKAVPASPLIVYGEVRNVRILEGSPQGWVEYELTMTLRFKNHGAEPLLLFVNDLYPWIEGKTLARSRDEALARQIIYESYTGLSCDWEGWKGTRDKLDQTAPPADLIRRIGPGESWSIDKIVHIAIEIQGSMDQRSKPWTEIRQADALWLRLLLDIWPSSLDNCSPKHKFAKRLQRKWKAYGHLVFDRSLSEPVLLRLPGGQ